ncbi:MAG: 5-formyltetrahydrofolate cyclo-ligase [Gammaproteobacteria bacterium]
MQDDIDSWRRGLRETLLARRQALPAASREAATAAIVTHLRAGLPAPETLTLAFFAPFRAEPDLRPLVDEWRAAGARTALPVVVARGQPMEFRLWWPGAPVRRGAFSLPEPDGTPLVTPQVVLLPPVGFDAEGYRLGYGGGFFDRTLAALTPAPLKIGVAFEAARVESIRPQPYDVPLDFVITEAGVWRVGAHGLEVLPAGAVLLPAGRRQADSAETCASPPCYLDEFNRGDA